MHTTFVDVESKVASGSMCEGFLPYVVQAPIAVELPPAAAATRSKSNATILIVEDEFAIRLLTKTYLESSGYLVIEAVDGAEAVMLWEEHKTDIDLVITDQMLPGALSGQQLVERLKADRAALKVIFVSGYSYDSSGDETFLDQSTHFLGKPYRLKNLADMVRECLGEKKAA